LRKIWSASLAPLPTPAHLNAVSIAVVATFYDAQGRVSGYSQALLPGPLAPGDALPFTIEGTPPGALVASHQLLVTGIAVPADETE
jgi:hypothetical protein